MKRVLSACSALCAAMLITMYGMLGLPATALADEPRQDQTTYDLVATPPETGTRDGSIPSKVWEVNKSGKYSFSGSSYGGTLYTNWKFKGKSSYTITVNNTGSATVDVKAKTLFTAYGSTRIAGGKSSTIELSGMNYGTSFYLAFTSVSGDGFSVSGSVR